MACKKLTVQEYNNLLLQNPNPNGYTTLEDCEGPCAGPGACSLDWRTAFTVNVEGFTLNNSNTTTTPGAFIKWVGGAGNLALWITHSYEPTSAPPGWNPSWGTPVGMIYSIVNMSCLHPPTYEYPRGGGFGAFFNSRVQCSLTDQSGTSRSGCTKLANFTVVLGPDGLPTRIKNVTYLAKTCSDDGLAADYCANMPDWPSITFGR